jgi:hypothetical protein
LANLRTATALCRSCFCDFPVLAADDVASDALADGEQALARGRLARRPAVLDLVGGAHLTVYLLGVVP